MDAPAMPRSAVWLGLLASLGAGCSEPIRGSGDAGPPDAPTGLDAPAPIDAPPVVDAPTFPDTPEDAPTAVDVPAPIDVPGDAGPPEVTTAGGAAVFACASFHPIPGPDGDVPVQVEQFASGNPVASATVQVFPEEAGVPATCNAATMCQEAVTDGSGLTTMRAPAEAVRTLRVLATAGTLETFVNHSSVPTGAGATWNARVLEASLVGIAFSSAGRTRVAGTAILTGLVTDCSGATVGESTIRVFRASGTEVVGSALATDPFTAYVDSGLPRPALTRTSNEGSWFAGNVPVPAIGERLRVESWGVVGGTYRRLGCETVLATPDGVGMVDLGPLRTDYSTGNPCGS